LCANWAGTGVGIGTFPLVILFDVVVGLLKKFLIRMQFVFEKCLAQGLFYLTLISLRALPAWEADQPDNFITNLCIQCWAMSAPDSRGLILRN
jgi:hypothetical protein